MRAVIAYLVLTKEAGVAGHGLALNRLPIVVGVIVKYDASCAASLKNNAVTGFSHDIVFNLVPAVPMVELYSVIGATVVACSVVKIIAPVFVGIAKLCPHVRRTGTVSSHIVSLHSFDPAELAEPKPNHAKIRIVTIEPHVFQPSH